MLYCRPPTELTYYFLFLGKASDFIAVELNNDKLHYILNLGYGPINIKDSSDVKLSDNKWHEVSIGRPSRYHHTLMVDGKITTQNTQGDNYHLDLDGILFLGKHFIAWDYFILCCIFDICKSLNNRTKNGNHENIAMA